jgi:hypothetical protein
MAPLRVFRLAIQPALVLEIFQELLRHFFTSMSRLKNTSSLLTTGFRHIHVSPAPNDCVTMNYSSSNCKATGIWSAESLISEANLIAQYPLCRLVRGSQFIYTVIFHRLGCYPRGDPCTALERAFARAHDSVDNFARLAIPTLGINIDFPCIWKQLNHKLMSSRRATQGVTLRSM